MTIVFFAQLDSRQKSMVQFIAKESERIVEEQRRFIEQKLTKMLRDQQVTVIQRGLEYQTFEFRIHSNSERSKVLFSNGEKFCFECSVLEWSKKQNGRISLGRLRKIIYKMT